MSLNCVMVAVDGHTPVPLAQEKMFFTQEGVHMTLDCNESDYPGHTEAHWQGKGNVILSNKRVIWIVSSGKEPQLTSLNIPIRNLTQWKLEQPWFGANAITGIVSPVPQGGLPRPGKLRLVFQHGGAVEFTNIFQSLLERMHEMSSIPQHLESLPTYTPNQAAEPSDLPPRYDEL